MPKVIAQMIATDICTGYAKSRPAASRRPQQQQQRKGTRTK
jgi:hypothetical protein